LGSVELINYSYHHFLYFLTLLLQYQPISVVNCRKMQSYQKRVRIWAETTLMVTWESFFLNAIYF